MENHKFILGERRTLREGVHDRLMRRIFVPKYGEVKKAINTRNEELHNL